MQSKEHGGDTRVTQVDVISLLTSLGWTPMTCFFFLIFSWTSAFIFKLYSIHLLFVVLSTLSPWCQRLAMSSITCALKAGSNNLYWWNETLVLPLLFQWLELCLPRFSGGTPFTALKSSDVGRVCGSNVIVTYWLHYSWKHCGKSLNHWPLACRMYQEKT